MRLHPFYDETEEIGANSVEGSEVAAEQTEESEKVTEETTEETTETTTETTTEDVTKQESFAKRLKESTEKAIAEERAKWQKEESEKYKDYDVLKKTADFFQRRHGYNDLMTMKEEIELAELNERAEKQEVSPEIQKRIEQLEAKAAKADELELISQQEKEYREFRSNLEKFAEKKKINADELHQFMADNQVANLDVAYRALRAEQLEKELETSKKDAVKEYLESKKAPKAEGTGTAGVANVPPKTWEESRQRALERMRAANNPQ